ncbi:butyrophilin subfamily 1 member A1-like [Pelodiscus sinensis]|uniref:butyrophilin subfamily 1 member A1-like n=1 Tax=Pelodiscus sinensis TaxID=13735 RepID=UPI003F6D2542
MEVLSVGSSLHELIIFFLMLCVPGLDSARFSVIGPDHPVTAVVGEEIVLPCHLSPRMSAENMEVRWFRHELTPFVHLYRRGEEEFGQQMPEYHGRTELLKDGITNGNVHLGILNVRPSDEGQYRCSVQEGDFQEEAVLELEVAASGSAPQISVEGYQDGGIQMVCHLAGWYPEPEVLWRDLSGQRLSSSVETKSRDAQGLFEIKSSLVVTERSNQNVSCSVRIAHFSLEKDPSTFYMSDSFFPRASLWMVGWSVTLVILLVFVCLAWFLFRLTGKIRTELEWRRALLDAANVTLDPDTAHPLLVLLEDGKRVRWTLTEQPRPDTPERFDYWECALGCEGFTWGRHYWEVEVGDRREWAVGVARESVSRKGEISLSPREGIWAVGWWLDQFQALTDPVTLLPLSPPSRIRVCLDCDRGQVTFIDAGTEASIFTFLLGSLPGERIRPWILVWDTDTELRLCP